VAELAGSVGDRESRIALAAPVAATDLEAEFADQIERAGEVAWDAAAGAVRARRVDRLGALVLRERSEPSPAPAAVAEALLGAVATRCGGAASTPRCRGPRPRADCASASPSFAR
jgi:ATP-dependent helicase HrpB